MTRKDPSHEKRIAWRPTNYSVLIAFEVDSNTFFQLLDIMAALLKTSPSIYIVGAKRTAFGSFGGSLSKLSATELGVHSTKAALAQSAVDPSTVGAVYFGNVVASSPDAPYLARHVALKCDLPTETPALTINRLCGSGFETVVQGAKSILLGETDVAVCGGTENMSGAPFQIDGNAVRWGVNLGTELKMRDALWDGLTDVSLLLVAWNSICLVRTVTSHIFPIYPFYF